MDFLNDLSTEQVLDYGTKALGAILVLIIGFWIANRIAKMIGNRMRKSTSDPTAANFITDIMSVLLKVLVILTAASTMGIEMTSFAAIIAAMGLAVGLALQGSLSNFAGGVMMAIFKPFEIGDLIEAQGHTGVVQGLNMFVTTLTTPDSKTVIIPNGDVYKRQVRVSVDTLYLIGGAINGGNNRPITDPAYVQRFVNDVIFGINFPEEADKIDPQKPFIFQAGKRVYINLRIRKMSLIGIGGKSMDFLPTSEFEIPNDLSAGMYLLKVITDKGKIATRKILLP